MTLKLDPKFRGPYKIIKILSNDRYEAERVGNRGKRLPFKFAHEQLRLVPASQTDVDFDFADLTSNTDEPTSKNNA